ncbi:TBCC domain-containing protein 1 [Aphelenchoides besseyi]|nr:TBCC domain-containing protein 1 [Aphelenchoides besseyi]KAI6208626.1 TBCC domain-containing protein 1 [Aphelenchoides besseyi]
MTLMDTSAQYFRPRLVLWIRGRFLFGSNFQGFALHKSTDPIQLSLRFLWHQFSSQRSRLVSFHDWVKIATTKMSISTEAAFAIFISVQQLIPVPGEKLLVNLEEANLKAKADLLGLLLVLAFTGCPENENGRRDVVSFMKSRLDELLALVLLCHYHLADEHIQTVRFEGVPMIKKIPRGALVNLDPFIEGTMRTERTMSTADVLPQPFSDLVDSVLCADQNDEYNYAEVVRVIRKCLQMDMFALDEMPRKKMSSDCHYNQTSRTVTSTQLSEHRKLTVRQWTHLELLTKSAYRGANLRIYQDSFMAGSSVFCLRALRTVMVGFSTDCGPIILGPIADLLLLRNLRNVVISAVCSRIQLENCRNVTVFVNTKTSPIVSCNCEEIKLAPYNVFYDALQYELKYVEMKLLNQDDNQWNRPVFIEAADSRDGETQQRSRVHLLPADHFYIQPTPFAQDTNSEFYKIFYQSISTVYMSNFEKRRSIASSWVQRNPEHKLIGISDLDRDYLQRRVTS